MYSEPSSNRAQMTSIEHLQNYIAELTIYINENNSKYNKNMHTLKTFYEQQIQQFDNQRQDLKEQRLRLKNQLVTVKDLYVNRNKYLAEKESQAEKYKSENQEIHQKLIKERLAIDSLYEQLSQIRQKCKQEVDGYMKSSIALQQQNNDLLIALKNRQSEIGQFKKKIYDLENQISSRFSLPEKLQEMEISQAKTKTQVQNLKQQKKELLEKIDYLNIEMQKIRKQNENLRISKTKSTAEVNLEIEKHIKNQRDNYEQKIKNLQILNQSQAYQISSLEVSVKNLRKQLNELQAEFKRVKSQLDKVTKEHERIKDQKNSYLIQFTDLKNEYESVIKRLEDSLIQYQKKNWGLEQQNKDLNDQLDGLQELLRQIKSMNTMQPLRQDYRKLAELEVLASKDRKQTTKQYDQKKRSQNLNHGESPISEDLGSDWQKLMLEIQAIQI